MERGQEKFLCSPRVRMLELGEETALLCERDGVYQVLQLNVTASTIWRALAHRKTRLAAQSMLENLGASARQAKEFVDAQVLAWTELGFLTPIDIIDLRSKAPVQVLSLALDETHVRLELFGNCATGDIESAFASLKTDQAQKSNVVISVVGEGEHDHVFVNDEALGRGVRRSTAPRLKAALLDEYLSRAREGFCTHAAIVSFDGKRVLLSGEPGAGKSTLALALAGEGFAYGGDDTARVAGDGRIKGLPFAAAVKTGSWPLVKRWHGEIETLATHERLDGQSARYFSPAHRDERGYFELFAALRLQRTPGARAHIVPIAPLEVFCALLESAYSEHVSADKGPTCAGLAQVLSKAHCGRLIYEDLAEAVMLIRSLVAGSARAHVQTSTPEDDGTKITDLKLHT